MIHSLSNSVCSFISDEQKEIIQNFKIVDILSCVKIKANEILELIKNVFSNKNSSYYQKIALDHLRENTPGLTDKERKTPYTKEDYEKIALDHLRENTPGLTDKERKTPYTKEDYEKIALDHLRENTPGVRDKEWKTPYTKEDYEKIALDHLKANTPGLKDKEWKTPYTKEDYQKEATVIFDNAESECKIFHKKNEAATKIQSAFRGFKVRSLAKAEAATKAQEKNKARIDYLKNIVSSQIGSLKDYNQKTGDSTQASALKKEIIEKKTQNSNRYFYGVAFAALGIGAGFAISSKRLEKTRNSILETGKKFVISLSDQAHLRGAAVQGFMKSDLKSVSKNIGTTLSSISSMISVFFDEKFSDDKATDSLVR